MYAHNSLMFVSHIDPDIDPNYNFNFEDQGKVYEKSCFNERHLFSNKIFLINYIYSTIEMFDKSIVIAETKSTLKCSLIAHLFNSICNYHHNNLHM